MSNRHKVGAPVELTGRVIHVRPLGEKVTVELAGFSYEAPQLIPMTRRGTSAPKHEPVRSKTVTVARLNVEPLESDLAAGQTVAVGGTVAKLNGDQLIVRIFADEVELVEGKAVDAAPMRN